MLPIPIPFPPPALASQRNRLLAVLIPALAFVLVAGFFCVAQIQRELRTDTRVLLETADAFFDTVSASLSAPKTVQAARRAPRVEATATGPIDSVRPHSSIMAGASADDHTLLARIAHTDGLARMARVDLTTLQAHARGRTSESGHALRLTWQREPASSRMLAGDPALHGASTAWLRAEQGSVRHPFSVSAAIGLDGLWRHFSVFLPALLLGAIGAGIAGHLIFTRRRQQADAPAAQLAGALQRGEFEGYLQPIIELNSGECTGAEMLMRWRHPRLGLLGPAHFLHDAQASGLLWQMTQACFATVATRLDASEHLPDGFMLCVNVGSAQLLLENDSHRFATLARPGGRRWYTVLELPEREARDPAMSARLASLQDRGFLIAVDDFGSAHSGARWLERQSIDLVKIDASIVATIGTDSVTRPVLDAIVGLARETGVRLIAEGVETASQRAQLRRLGVAYAQGYAFSPALPVDDFVTDWLDNEASDEDPSLPARNAYPIALRVLRA